MAKSEESKLREMLWLGHGCPFPALYGDDGEMQCSNCGIDFKRDTADKINQKLVQRNISTITEGIK